MAAFYGSKSSFIPCQLLGAAHGVTVSPSKSTATWEDVPDMALNIEPPSNSPILPWFDLILFLDPSLADPVVSGEVRWAVDGVGVTGSTRAFGYRTPSIVGLTTGDLYPSIVLPQLRLEGIVGQVSLSAQWRVTVGTAVAYSTHRSIQAVSLPY